MAEADVADVAFERAWGVYVLMRKNIDANDERRGILERFIRQRCEAGDGDAELLAVEGLKFLKRREEQADASFVPWRGRNSV